MWNASAAEVNPTARLEVVQTTTLWKSPDGKIGAQRARFSPDGKWLAWFTGKGEIGLAPLRDGNKVTMLATWPNSTITDLVWSKQSMLAACLRSVKADGELRQVAVVRPGETEARLILDTSGAYNVAWRADGKAIAFSTKTALFHRDFATGRTVKLLDGQKGWRPKGAPAYADLVFYGHRTVARVSGTMTWNIATRREGSALLTFVRGVCPDASRGRLFTVPWTPGPVGIPRGCGVTRIARHLPSSVVPSGHSTGKPYWLVDIWDATYPTTLRVSADGKTLTFCGVKCGVPSENAWREFCIWRVPADGSEPPTAVAKCGNIFKRIDVGDTHFIGWRYKIDNAIVLGDLTRGKAWRLPDDFYVQRVNTDVLVDKLLVGAARGKDVVLMQLAEEK
jgi:hypothetical protein